MNGPYLLVSIPPALRGARYTYDDEQSLQNHAIQSWKDSGFLPVSVNTSAELNRFPDHAQQLAHADVTVLSVESPATLYPDYLPPLKASLIKATEAFPDSTVAITNADIIFTGNILQDPAWKYLNKSTFLVAHRTDVDALPNHALSTTNDNDSRPNPSIYRSGIDVVIANAECFRSSLSFLSADLTFGLPWWDLYLPLALMACNLELHHLNPDQFLHLRHTDRWDESWWNLIGKKATNHLALSLQSQQGSPGLDTWHDDVSRVYTPIRTLKKELRLLRSKLHAVSSGNRYTKPLDPQLIEIANLTESLVCDASRDTFND